MSRSAGEELRRGGVAIHARRTLTEDGGGRGESEALVLGRVLRARVSCNRGWLHFVCLHNFGISVAEPNSATGSPTGDARGCCCAGGQRPLAHRRLQLRRLW